MVDVFGKRKRSWVMSRVKQKDTEPERYVRSLLHRNGFRFTVNGPRNRRLPGKPDIVLPKYRTVVLVHGCFWHGHKGCRHFRIPKTRTEWWTTKIEENRRRDWINQEKLNALGWRVVVIWTCEFDTVAKRSNLASRIASLINPQCKSNTPLIAAETKGSYTPFRKD